MPGNGSCGTAVGWGHNLLAAAEQVLFRRLSVFRRVNPARGRGGRGRNRVPAETALDLLERLVRQSLVIVDHTGGHTPAGDPS